MKSFSWKRLADNPNATTLIDVRPLEPTDSTARVFVYTRDIRHAKATLRAVNAAIFDIIEGIEAGEDFGLPDENNDREYERTWPLDIPVPSAR
jgi:hypothetical protein